VVNDRLTITQVADELGCSTDTVYVLMRDRQLGYIQTTPRTRQVTRQQLDNYLARNVVPAKGELPPILPPVRHQLQGGTLGPTRSYSVGNAGR
jgi:excisionase family DNA binding protein